jgi:SfnB family sulfur acquisition oxidoreductase
MSSPPQLLGAIDARSGAAHKAHVIRSDEEAIDTAKRLAKEFRKTADGRDRERLVPLQEVEILSQSGLLAAIVPREYGGAGITIVTLVRVLQILSAADGSLGQIPQNHFHFLNFISAFGTPEQKSYFLPKILAGQRLGNGLQERGNGVLGTGKLATTLTSHADGSFRLNGEKRYCTGAFIAHWLPVMAATPEGDGILVYTDRKAPGVEVFNDWNGMGQRTTLSGTARFRDVPVAELHVFRRSFEGYSPHGLSYAQLLHAAIDTGIAEGALTATAEFAREHARPWFEAKVEKAGEDPLLIKQYGELIVDFQAAEALTYRAASLLDAALADETNEAAGLEAVLAVAGARVQADRAALHAGHQLFEFGGAGATNEKWNLNRYWRDARTHTLHDPIRWRLHHLGNYHLNGVKPPRDGSRRTAESQPASSGEAAIAQPDIPPTL